MSAYHITDYSYKQAELLNVTIEPSSNKRKKIDVFQKGNKIASIGAINYYDYPNYVLERGITYCTIPTTHPPLFKFFLKYNLLTPPPQVFKCF